MSVVGVLAIQGDFEKHLQSLQNCPSTPQAIEVRTQTDLDQIDRLIIPGGESSTVGMLLERHGLGDAIIQRANVGMPIWGTCMGMIILAKRIEQSQQYTLGLLDVTVRRNAFGAQVHSFEAELEMKGLETPITGVFIRAPIIIEHASTVEPLCTINNQVVAVRQGNLIGTSFHPELTDDTRLHEWFLGITIDEARH